MLSQQRIALFSLHIQNQAQLLWRQRFWRAADQKADTWRRLVNLAVAQRIQLYADAQWRIPKNVLFKATSVYSVSRIYIYTEVKGAIL